MAEIPLPVLPELGRSYAMLLAGIGGTGVITVSAILAQAAHLDGNAVLALDQTGPRAEERRGALPYPHRGTAGCTVHRSHRAGAGGPDPGLRSRDGGRAGRRCSVRLLDIRKAVVDRHVVPTAAFVKDNAVDLKAETLLRIIGRAIDAEAAALDATGLATGLSAMRSPRTCCCSALRGSAGSFR